jgi:integrase
MMKHSHTASARPLNEVAVTNTLPTAAPPMQLLTCKITVQQRGNRGRPAFLSRPRTLLLPDELKNLLRLARPAFLPALVIAAFAGLRYKELQALDWADVRLDDGHILVLNGVRSAPISKNLEAWLRPSAQLHDQGASAIGPQEQIHQQAAAIGISHLFAALRLSFITYRGTLTGDWCQAAAEAGIPVAQFIQRVQPCRLRRKPRSGSASCPNRCKPDIVGTSCIHVYEIL